MLGARSPSPRESPGTTRDYTCHLTFAKLISRCGARVRRARTGINDLGNGHERINRQKRIEYGSVELTRIGGHLTVPAMEVFDGQSAEAVESSRSTHVQ